MKHSKIIFGQDYVTNSGRHVTVNKLFEGIPYHAGTHYMCTPHDALSFFGFGSIVLSASDIRWTKEHYDRKQKHLEQQRDSQQRNYEAKSRRVVEKANKLMVLLGIERSVYSSSVSSGNVNIVFNEHELSMLLTKLADSKS